MAGLQRTEEKMNIQIFLRDKNIDLVNAWKKEFDGCKNVEVSCGDIFDLEADAIISPANSFGFMGGGIDLVYSKYFGRELEKALQEKIRSDFHGELPVGLAAIVKTKNDKIKFLVSCPTMRVPEEISTTVNAYLSFRAGLIEVEKFNRENDQKIKSILCPGLGTLSGRIPVSNCAKQMRYAYDLIVCHRYDFPTDSWTARDLHNKLK